MRRRSSTAPPAERSGKEAAKYGIKVGYHNHTQEFNKIGDKYFLEILIENTDPENVVFELDCGWATAAGADACEFLKKYADRYVAIHVKENNKVIGPRKAPFPQRPQPLQAGRGRQADHHRGDAQSLRRAGQLELRHRPGHHRLEEGLRDLP